MRSYEQIQSDCTRYYEFRKPVHPLMDFEPVILGLAIDWLKGSVMNTFSLRPVTLLCPCSMKQSQTTDSRLNVSGFKENFIRKNKCRN